MKSEPTNDATSTNIINYSSMPVKNLRIIAKENSISKYYIMKKSLLIKEIEKCMNDKNNDTK